VPNPVTITVENPSEILDAGLYGAGALVRLQAAVAEAGPFADVSGTGSDPTTTVELGRRAYTAMDPNGIQSTWYRTRYENVGASRVSDWTDPFQVALEGGLICSLYDVKQRVNIDEDDDTADELLLEFIRHATDDIIGATHRQFVRSPATGTATLLFDVGRDSRELQVPKGIATLTQLEVATQSQPDSGGTYVTVPVADWFLRPVTAERERGWPATKVVITDRPTGAIPHFYAGYNVVRAAIALGFAAVPGDIAGVGESAVVRRWKAKQSGQADIVGSSEFGARTLRFISPEERLVLDRYRVYRV